MPNKLLLLALFFSPTAFADDWSSADTAREAVYLTLHTIDWGQTRYAAKHPDRFHEINPLIGEHPSINHVNKYMVTSALLHVTVANVLPPPWRERFQYVTIGIKASLVAYNFSAGVRLDF